MSSLDLGVRLKPRLIPEHSLEEQLCETQEDLQRILEFAYVGLSGIIHCCDNCIGVAVKTFCVIAYLIHVSDKQLKHFVPREFVDGVNY